MDKAAWRSDPLIRLITDHENVSEYVENLEKMLDSFYDAEAWERLTPIEAFFRQNVIAHFAFEEKTIFPALRERIAEPDDLRLLDDLTDEHVPIRALVTEFIGMASDSAAAEGKESRTKLFGIAKEIVDKLQQHATKEDERLLPLISANLAFLTRPAGSARWGLRPRSRCEDGQGSAAENATRPAKSTWVDLGHGIRLKLEHDEDGWRWGAWGHITRAGWGALPAPATPDIARRFSTQSRAVTFFQRLTLLLVPHTGHGEG